MSIEEEDGQIANVPSSSLTRPPLSSVGSSASPSSGGGRQSVGSDTATLAEDGGKEGQPSLGRQSSERYHSDEMRSGEGVIGQPESSRFPSSDNSQGVHKVLPGERSIGVADYQRKLSHASSSTSSCTLDHPPTGLQQDDSSTSRTMSELKERHDEDVTTLTERLSAEEKRAEGLKREKEKLERKLKEAEEVAEQASVAALQVSHLESELKNEKEKMSRLLRDKSVDPETAHSLQLSNDLQIVRARLDFEVSAKAALEHEMTSLKESLVVNGKGNFGKNATLITELRVEVAREKEKICQLEQSLAEKEAEVKRQTQIQARTISDLQSKLSRERQQREELRQSVPTPGAGPRTSGASSPDTARVLQEKEKTIEELVYKLQKLEKTASEVVKIAQHSKTQSETIVTLKGDLRHAQEVVAEKEAALNAVQEEMRTHYDNTLRMKNTDLAQRREEKERLSRQVDDLQCQVTELTRGVEEGKTSRTQLQQLLEKTDKECNHWKQKSVQQGIVIQSTQQDVTRLHREANGLQSTVSAQGKEVERLQRENQTLQGEIETHRLTAMTYKEDFETERKDREAVHTRIANMETQYRHQLESIGEELQRKTEEAKTHREALANTEELLLNQQKQMNQLLQEKEEELKIARRLQQKLHEDVMSKTQQVKQYKKQIEQLNCEVVTYKQAAEAHMSQVEALAKKTEDYGRQRTFKELHEKKIVQLEAQCDQLRAENNELRMKLSGGGGGGGDQRLRPPPVMKAQTLGAPPSRQQDKIQVLPNPHLRPGVRPSSDDGGLSSRAGGSSHSNKTNREAGLPANHQRPLQPPGQNSPGFQGRQGMAGQPNIYNSPPASSYSPYSSLPSSGFGVFGHQNQQRPGYAQDDSNAALYSPAGDMVDKDSPPSSTVGQGGLQSQQQLQPGQQRRAHSQIHSMSAHKYAPPGHSRPPVTGSRQPPNSQFYHNLPPRPAPPPNTVPPNNSSSGGGQPMYMGGQMSPVRVTGQPSPQMRPPPTQDVPPRGNQLSRYSFPVEESHRRVSSRAPQLEGYVKPHQVSLRATGDNRMPVTGRPDSSHPPPVRPPVSPHHCRPDNQALARPAPATGDISRDIDREIEQTASKVREAEQVLEGGDGEGIPYDPNLVCPKCRMRFREGEIQKYRRHVSSAHI